MLGRTPMDVYVEAGAKRVFAGAVEWPGWSRSGRGEEKALQALLDYGPRYRDAIGPGFGFPAPSDIDALKVVERLQGNATTDFGAPAMAPSADEGPIDAGEAKRLASLLEACWYAFDRSAKDAKGKELRKGPRGGGRALDRIVEHVLGAEEAYLRMLGGLTPKDGDADAPMRMARVRERFRDAFLTRAGGDDPPRVPPLREAVAPPLRDPPIGVARPRPRLGDRGPGHELTRVPLGRTPRADRGQASSARSRIIDRKELSSR